MNRRTFLGASAAAAAGAALSTAGVAHANTGATLKEALEKRGSSRSYSPKDLPEPLLMDMLWAGFGVNRPDSGKRTAPSAMNWQEIDIFAARKNGLFLYNAQKHALEKVGDEDIRAETGMQGYVADAPVNLIFVADFDKMKKQSKENKILYSAMDTGFISQNIYLFCAVNDLATVVRAYIDHDVLRKKMPLRDEQKITLAQCVGYPG